HATCLIVLKSIGNLSLSVPYNRPLEGGKSAIFLGRARKNERSHLSARRSRHRWGDDGGSGRRVAPSGSVMCPSGVVLVGLARTKRRRYGVLCFPQEFAPRSPRSPRRHTSRDLLRLGKGDRLHQSIMAT